MSDYWSGPPKNGDSDNTLLQKIWYWIYNLSQETGPSPIGLATKANQQTQITAEQAILAKLIAAPATAANQSTQITAEQAILAKIIAAPATEAKQDTQITAEQAITPGTTAAAVTPSDATALTSRAVWVGGAGDLSVRLSGATGTTVVFTAVPAGSLLPLSVVRVMAATTATNINVIN